jgi:hypothetical protein
LKYVTWQKKQRKRPHDREHTREEKKQPEEGAKVKMEKRWV